MRKCVRVSCGISMCADLDPPLPYPRRTALDPPVAVPVSDSTANSAASVTDNETSMVMRNGWGGGGLAGCGSNGLMGCNSRRVGDAAPSPPPLAPSHTHTPGSRATMVPSSPIATRLRRNESPAKSAARTPSPNSVVLTNSFSSNFDRLK